MNEMDHLNKIITKMQGPAGLSLEEWEDHKEEIEVLSLSDNHEVALKALDLRDRIPTDWHGEIRYRAGSDNVGKQ